MRYTSEERFDLVQKGNMKESVSLTSQSIQTRGSSDLLSAMLNS